MSTQIPKMLSIHCNYPALACKRASPKHFYKHAEYLAEELLHCFNRVSAEQKKTWQPCGCQVPRRMLPDDLAGNLNDASVVRSVDHAEDRRIHIRVRRSKVDVVERIERLGPELQLHPLHDRKVLE